MTSEKAQTGIQEKEVKEGNDPFCGTVAIFENTAMGEEPKRFWAEHPRKDIYTDYLTIEEAEAKYDEFVNDTMF